MRSVILITVFTLMIVLPERAMALSGADESPRIDPAAFAQMDRDGQLAVITAALQHRDAQLSNCAYDVTETSINVSRTDPVVTKKVQGDQVFGVKHLGSMHRLDLKRSRVADGTVSELATNWDGRSARSLTKLPQRTFYTGTIRDAENSNFVDLYYNCVLGLRPPVRLPISLAQWLTQSVSEGNTPQITQSAEAGKPFVAVRLYDGELCYRQIDLDPAYELMPVRITYAYEHGKDFNRAISSVTDIKRIDGVWVPMQVVRHISSSASSEYETRTVYSVSNFSIGTVRATDIDIAFPIGTEVVDAVQSTAYKVERSGRVDPMPVFNSHTGKVIYPNSANALPHATHRLGLMIASGVAAVALVIAIYVRRKRNWARR